ncbi:mCG148197 [Mus musculus]|nr:mCG148197 [Mus musculus]
MYLFNGCNYLGFENLTSVSDHRKREQRTLLHFRMSAGWVTVAQQRVINTGHFPDK